MKKLLWLLLGVAGGFVLAHVIDKDPRGHEVLADIDARVSEFTDRIADAYRAQEARLATAVTHAEDAAATAVARAEDAAADAIARAQDAATDAAAHAQDLGAGSRAASDS
jgi:hypothetical protein